MKKLLVFALCATIAGIASAGSIQWEISMGKKGYIADSLGNKMNGNLYFILTSSADALADAVATDTFATVLASVSLGDPLQLTDGKSSNVTTVTEPSTVLAVGETYSFSLVVYDVANKQYYLSAALSEKAYDESAEVVTANSITFDTSHVGSTFTANWSPTTPVPEPSTAALALAGLALLLKRRKA